jgi:hypothetical protein
MNLSVLEINDLNESYAGFVDISFLFCTFPLSYLYQSFNFSEHSHYPLLSITFRLFSLGVSFSPYLGFNLFGYERVIHALVPPNY